ncbi:caspase b-like isoform X1 [Scomber scombrus]|uniref:Caspase b-like isoform X1 n=1 Tax=Scomber scombrus TaxID=13677 RepID=A0AAV1PM50_SCOSC
MQVPLLILDTLDELSGNEFKRFQWNLTQEVLSECKPFRKGQLENQEREDIVNKMINSYGEEPAVNVTAEILKRINYNNAADKLKKAYAGGSADGKNPPPPSSSSSSSSSSSDVAPAVGASVFAKGGSVIVAPNIQGASSGGSAAGKNPPTPSSSSSSSSSDVAPAVGASVCAQGGSRIVAPNYHDPSSGVSMNININTQ